MTGAGPMNSNNGVDIMQMLSKAQHEYDKVW